MKKFLVVLLLLSLVLANKGNNNKHADKNKSSSEEEEKTKASAPTNCRIPVDSAGRILEEGKPSPYFFDPGQFLSNGGYFAHNSDLTYWSFCREMPNKRCDSSHALCSKDNQLAPFETAQESTRKTGKDKDHVGLTMTYHESQKTVAPTSTCAHGKTWHFILACTRPFNSDTNYTITSVSTDGCTTNVSMNTPAGCLLEAVAHTAIEGQSAKMPLFVIVMSVIAGVVLICACFVMCCVVCKFRRDRCAARRGACHKKAEVPQVPLVRPQPPPQPIRPLAQPRPPMTPPPAPQVRPLVPQPLPQGQYFVPPQAMYPNLYNGGYVPFVPMMVQPPQQQQQRQQAPPVAPQNPFLVPMSNATPRDAQMAEDERLARVLQAQFNNEA